MSSNRPRRALTHRQTGQVDCGENGILHGRWIDEAPELLEQSYCLRYQVYCLERKFLPAEHCPDGRERDEFDPHSIHFGAVDDLGELAGTARVVRANAIGLPLFRHCTMFDHETGCNATNTRMVEVGRLVVNRAYRRRADDDLYGVNAGLAAGYPSKERRRQRDASRYDVLLTLAKAVYQATKRIGATGWLAAMEKSLERLLARHGMPFRLIGPQSDYFGLVAPYLMELEELDHVIASGRFPKLEDFVVGLEPGLRPPPAEDDPPTLTWPALMPKSSPLLR